MMKLWPHVRLGDIIREDREAVGTFDGDGLPVLGVTNIEGVTHTGVEASDDRSKYLRLRPRRFVYNPYRINVGSLGLSAPHQNGICSPAYVVFSPSDRVDPNFLLSFLKSARGNQLINFHGNRGSVRSALRFDDLCQVELPLPPLTEQQRIVARIKELAAQIAEARSLRQEAAEEAEALMVTVLYQVCCGKTAGKEEAHESARQLLNRISRRKWAGHVEARKRKPTSLPLPPKVPSSWLVIEAGELQECGAILDIQDGNHGGDYPRKSEFTEDGVPFVTARQFDHGTIRISEAPRLSQERATKLRIGFAKANDVLLTHNASVGDVAIAPHDTGDFLLGTSATYWRCNSEALDKRYLFYFMRSQHFQGQLQFIMKQTTRNQVSVLKQVNLWICLPPLEEQRRIVAELDALQAEVDALKRLQTETAAELDALLPSILDKAFRGEL